MFKLSRYNFSFNFFGYIMVALLLFSSCTSTRKYSNSTHHKTRKKDKTHRSSTKHHKPRTSKTKYTSTDSRLRGQLLTTAKKYIGTKYVYGGKKPGGFDCSGFVTWVMNKNGVELSGSSSMIAKKGRRKSMQSLQKGDLVFFGKGSKVSHIAIVVENNNVLKVIHSTSSRGVVIDEITNSPYWKKKYLFGRSVI